MRDRSQLQSRGQAQAQIRPEDIPELLGQGQERMRALQRKLIGPQVAALGGTIGGTWGDLAQGALDMAPMSGYAWAEGKLPNVVEGGTFPSAAEAFSEGDYLTWGLQKAAKAGDALSAAGIASALANPGIGAAMFLGGRGLARTAQLIGPPRKNLAKFTPGHQAEAYKELNLGLAKQDIYKRTGWAEPPWEEDTRTVLRPDAQGQYQPGPPDQMRFEISDSLGEARFTKPKTLWGSDSAGRQGPLVYRADEVLDHPTLYEAYPELASKTVLFDPGTPGGLFEPGPERIRINSKLSEADSRSVLLHEMQHWIQYKENWQGGANPRQAARALLDWNDPEGQRLRYGVWKTLEKTLDYRNAKAQVYDKFLTKPELQRSVKLYHKLQKESEDLYKQLSSVEGVAAEAAQPIHVELRIKEKGTEILREQIVKDLFGKPISQLDPTEDSIFINVLYPDKAWTTDARENLEQLTKLNRHVAAWKSGDVAGMAEAIADEGTGYQIYRRISGEVEARLVQRRSGFMQEALGRNYPYREDDMGMDLSPTRVLDLDEKSNQLRSPD
jgi:hypothetical protein